MNVGTYSFQDCTLTVSGVGGVVDLTNGAAEEGFTFAYAEDKNGMTTGADGSVTHSLHAGNAGTVTVRLLKTSPANQLLSAMYNTQRVASAGWGKNVIVGRQKSAGDAISAVFCAFRKHPDLTYGKDAQTVEWTFDAGRIDPVLGAY